MLITELHAGVDHLFPARHATARLINSLVHALVDLGQVKDLECAWDGCLLPGVPLQPASKQAAPDAVSVDHIIAVGDGGSNHWGNLQLVHRYCNERKGCQMTPERRAAIAQTTREHWQDPEYRERITAAVKAGNNTPEARAKRSASLRAFNATPEGKLKRAESLRKAWETRRANSS